MKIPHVPKVVSLRSRIWSWEAAAPVWSRGGGEEDPPGQPGDAVDAVHVPPQHRPAPAPWGYTVKKGEG